MPVFLTSMLASHVEQSPSIVSIAARESATLNCTLVNIGYSNMFWYIQKSNRAIEALFYSAGEGFVTNCTADYFTAKRPSNTLFTLNLRDAALSHSAVYFCACKDTGLREAYFGSGTKLVVLEHEILSPTIALFAPSPEEIRDKRKATVVCTITDFYPDNIRIFWFVDGRPKPDNDTRVQTDLTSIAGHENKSFSITTRLRFEDQEWAQSKNVECKVEHYANGSDPTQYSSTLAINAEICGASKEEKMRSMATAKLTYLIVFCKSILYAIFVSIFAWKAKTSYSKRFD
ncbi:immunoglobulin lambda-1 light chain-like [Mustelus asterias]